MASKIKGITVKINGDVTELEKSIKEVNKEIKSTQYELKSVEKALKLDPKNIELLQQKQTLLTKSITETTKKLDLLKQQQAQMDADGVDKNSTAYQRLRREIIDSEAALKNLGTSSKEVNQELGQMTSKTASITEGFNKVSTAAGTVAQKTKGISLAAGGALTALAGIGIKAAANADDLNTMAKQTGLSTEALQEMQYASSLIDVDIETIVSSVKKMKKSLDTNADAFNEIGVEIKNANGEYRSTEDIFNDVIAALGKIENETERDIKAMDLFGRSADDLAGLIDDGGKALKELGAQAKNKGLIISQTELDKANEMNDKLDTLKANISGSLGQAAISVLEALAPALQVISDVLTSIAGVIAQLDPQTVQVVATIALIIAAISPIAGLISGITSAISIATTAITTINAVIAANPIVLIITAIVAAIALLVAAGVAIYKNWDKIKAAAAALWNGLKETFTKLANWLSDIGGKIGEWASNLWNGLKETFNKITSFVGDFVKGALNWGKDMIDNMINGIKSKITAVVDAVKGIAGKIAGFLGFSEPDVGPLSKFHTFMPDMIDLMKKGINDNIYKLNQPLDALASKVAGNTQVDVNYNDSALTGRLDSINDSIRSGGTARVQILVEPDMEGIFRELKVIEVRNAKAAGA